MISGIDRLADAFAAPGMTLGTYLVGGYPSLHASVACAIASARAGAGFVELGLPARDPIADGPAIQRAGNQALLAGVTVDDVFGVAAEVAPHVPVVVMCYASIVLARGIAGFADSVASCGASGVIVADLPVGAADALSARCRERRLAYVPVVGATMDDAALSAACRRASGFVYLAQGGSTGERDEMPARTRDDLARIRRSTHLPVAVGFGVSTGRHVRGLAAYGADGAIAGSRIVRAAGHEIDAAGEVAAVTRELLAGGSDAMRPTHAR